jgi:hypothetical protein
MMSPEVEMALCAFLMAVLVGGTIAGVVFFIMSEGGWIK